MSVLIDTHVLLWWLDGSAKLGAGTTAWLREQPRIWVSAASVWEIAIKQYLGQLQAPDNLVELIAASGLESLPVHPEHAWSVCTIALPHRDPFDRLLLAQALHEGLTLVTADGGLLGAVLPADLRLRDARK